MDDFLPVPVSHHQFLVWADAGSGDDLPLFAVGDGLLQVTGAAQLTVLTGPHTGSVRVAATVTDGPPADPADGGDAVAEATVWCPHGRLGITGLMTGGPAALGDLAVPAGLVRIRVSARDRVHDDAVLDSAERYRVVAWPVGAAEGFRTLATDGLDVGTRPPDPAEAAAWAMARLVALANPDPRVANLRRAGGWTPPPADDVRVTVRRTLDARPKDVAALLDRVLPVGDLEIRLRPSADGTATWRWVAGPGASCAVPDEAPSTVTLRAADGRVMLTHDGVRAADAVLLGLVWDHLLTRDPAAPPPWAARFAEPAAHPDVVRKPDAAV